MREVSGTASRFLAFWLTINSSLRNDGSYDMRKSVLPSDTGRVDRQCARRRNALAILFAMDGWAVAHSTTAGPRSPRLRSLDGTEEGDEDVGDQ